MADRSQSQRKVSEASKRRREAGQESDAPGREARGGGLQVRTYQIGAAPILNHFLNRLRLEQWLRDHLPPDDPRTELPTARALLMLVRNLLLSREPIYGAGDWSAAFAPDVLDLFEDEWSRLQHDRPDLKQLLYTLAVTEDGGVPVYFGTASGNVVDDTTHRDTWDLLRELVGKPDFLYVADCKLSSQENLARIAQRGGRFITVLPASRREDGHFRQRLREQPAAIRWTELYQRTDERDEVCVTLSDHSDEETSSDGYRLLWYHSTRKRELDGTLLRVEIRETPRETYKHAQLGRPTSSTKYVRESRASYDLSMAVDLLAVAAAEAGDGVFPLLTNDRSANCVWR